MRLDWNDIKARAAHFADEWKDAHYERGESQSFYNAFFEVFGVPRKRVASFEHGVNLPDKKRGYLDLFWKGKLLVEQKSAGLDLRAARKQALDYFPALKDHELPRYILLSDFQTFELYDLDIDAQVPLRFALADLADHVQAFGFIVGQERRIFRDQDPANIAASEMMGALHDALEASGYKGHALEQFLVRLLFCLFADDTGIFQPLGIFEAFIAERTAEDGTDVGPLLMKLFAVLDTKESEREKALDADLTAFPYINGNLFSETLRAPSFNRDMREKLLNVCGFNWEKVSPAIFGSLFQSVMDAKERRKKGAHYTSEKNILKVIEPLFMDDLKAEFTRLKARRDTGRIKALQEFHGRLGGLTFFDPACGCGNFLVIAYRELRELELALIREIQPESQRVTDIGLLTRVNVDQFYGIELEEFPARIAEVAMWMMDHIMNVKLSAAFGESYLRIPLTTSPNIRHGDALEIEWSAVLAPEACAFVFGNPPFSGFVQRDEQKQAQMGRMAALGATGNRLDYVCAWFLKAGAYVRSAGLSPLPSLRGGEADAAIHRPDAHQDGLRPARNDGKFIPRIAFVSTNSITQGEQVAQLWPPLFERYGLEIAFGHRTFEWYSDARGGAHVHCVIIGLTRREDEPREKRLFSYEDISGDPVETRHVALSPYLFDASSLSNRHLVVARARSSLCEMPPINVGTKPVDNGIYIFDDAEREAFLAKEPDAGPIMRPFIGGYEHINSVSRWILYPGELEPAALRRLPAVMERIAAVRAFREKASGSLANELASVPMRFHVTVVPKAPYLAIPEVSSARRTYIPIGWLYPPAIPSNKILVMEKTDLFTLGVLSTKMHICWVSNIGGRLKSDFQYSPGIVYNPFPWPTANDAAKVPIRALAQGVLDARAAHPGSTLADLYDPDVMPPDLRRAHKALDEAVDRLYRVAPFASDRERVEHLFMLYEKLTADLVTKAAAPVKATRRRKV